MSWIRIDPCSPLVTSIVKPSPFFPSFFDVEEEDLPFPFGFSPPSPLDLFEEDLVQIEKSPSSSCKYQLVRLRKPVEEYPLHYLCHRVSELETKFERLVGGCDSDRKYKLTKEIKGGSGERKYKWEAEIQGPPGRKYKMEAEELEGGGGERKYKWEAEFEGLGERKYTWTTEIKGGKKKKDVVSLKKAKAKAIAEAEAAEAEKKKKAIAAKKKKKSYNWTTELKSERENGEMQHTYTIKASSGGGGDKEKEKEKEKVKKIKKKEKPRVVVIEEDDDEEEEDDSEEHGAILLRKAYSRRSGAVRTKKGKNKEMPPEYAAVMIQRAFRAYLIRRSKALRALRDLAIAKTKLKELRASFHNFNYRRVISRDAEERQKFSEKIIVLLLTVDAIEGVDVMVRGAKRSMVDELEAMLEVVDPQPAQGKSLSMRRRTFDMPDSLIRNEIAEGVTQIVQMLETEEE
ncbi:hypothetical protein Bca4012_023453 [Brassica carinata]|uniref:BCL-2-associated athanogene 7 n=1 Tax=Brassica carinata TaxID=52824 RepID=A0A8X7TEK5_BRACI|nr:hypothetical protein Bca52824_092527 [Brassica carinata]